jgi:membrane protease YdiL (CAAX protease family)
VRFQLRNSYSSNFTYAWSYLVIAIVKDPGPIGEEFGWRGFALPRLLERYSPLDASIRLGLIHAAWHIPLFFIPGMPQTQVSFLLFTLGVVSIAIFDTALYLRTDANLLLAILVHLLANVCGGFALDAHALNVFFAAEGIAAALIVVGGGLKSRGPSAPATLDPAVV